MNEQVVLVDFENVQKLDLVRLLAHAGSGVEANGPNTLDFHFACHLGKGLARTPQAEFVIVSRDTGFDSLLRHLKTRGSKCRRDGQASSTSVPKPQLPAHTQAVADLLRRSEKNKRPKKHATLANYLTSHFHTKLTAEEIKKAVEHLLEAGLIAGTEAAVAYCF